MVTYDGTCIRDFIHVMDLAEAHISALNFLKANKTQNISINIGTGKGTSVLEIIKTFQDIKGIRFLMNSLKEELEMSLFLLQIII